MVTRAALTVVALAVALILALTGCRDAQEPEPRPSYPRDGAEPPQAITPTTVAVIPPTRRFSSCQEARDAGAAPLTTGQEGYSTHLDRNRDGVACE